MIFDCFLFFNEWDQLKIRHEEFRNVDNVTHVLIESTFTHSGNHKPLYFQERAKEFPYNNIAGFVADDPAYVKEYFSVEKYQRNCIRFALEFLEVRNDDIIIISDVDEIVRASVVNDYDASDGFKALIMDKYNYYLNCLEGTQIWNRAKIMPYSYLKDKTPNDVRNSGYPDHIVDAGWHFGYLGGVQAVMEKLASFSHTEFNTPEFNNLKRLARKMEIGESLWNEKKWDFVDIDDSFPKYVRNHKNDSLKHLIKET